MAAPRKVKDMANLAERLIAERATPTTPEGGPSPTPDKPDLKVVAKPNVVEPKPQGDNPYAIDPATLGVPPPAAKPVVEASVTDDWEHKYKVLQGMMDRAKTDQNDRINQLENQIEVLTKMARPGTQQTFHPETPAAEKLDYGMTEEQIEEMGGQDFINSILKISAAGAAPEIKALRGEVDALRDSQTESHEDIFYTQLSSLAKSWRTINSDERFTVWLLEDEGLSGIPRKSFLDNAYENRDAETAARYFNEFAKLLPGSLDLQTEVTGDIIPETSGGGAPPVSTGTALYTPQSISNFYRDKGLGKFKGKEAEADAIENDIFAAQHDGRVIRRGTAPPIA